MGSYTANSPKSSTSKTSGTTPSNSPAIPSSTSESIEKKQNFKLFGPYKLGKTIGQGEFGKVKIGNHLQSGNEVAIKLIKKESIIQPSRKQKLIREIEILQSVNHRNIVKLWEVIETDNYIGMIMNYAEGGELFDHILTRRYLKDAEACRFFSQLILGVSYLHACGIVHRDLKLENLLLDKNRNLVITDFGFANRFERGSKEGDLLSTSCGSACYAAPELVINDKYSAEGADIWSCGVILFAMVCGYLPYDDDPTNKEGENINKLYKYIMETKLHFPSQVSIQAQHLILRILVTDPEKRAKMTEIQSHRWLSAYKNDFISQQESLPRTTPTSIVRTNLVIPETRSGRSSVQMKKASNPMLLSIQESPREPSVDKSITPTIMSSTTPSAGISTVIGGSPLSSTSYSTPPPLALPTVPSGITLSGPASSKVLQLDQDIENIVPSVTDTANKKITYRKSTELPPPPIKKEEDNKEAGAAVKDSRNFVSMDQSRAGIVGITDGLDEEFKKLEGINQLKSGNNKKPSKHVAAISAKVDDSPQQSARDFYFLKTHSGPIDRRAITTKSAHRIQKHVIETLQEMGFVLYLDPYDQFKIKAVQVQEADGKPIKRSGKRSNAVTEIFERIKYVGQFGLQYNRGFTGTSTPPPPRRKQEQAEPIKMSIMIHRIKNLDGLLTVDVKRTRGDIWEFKGVYEDLIQKLNLSIS